jgi:hypothetical protein
MIMFWWASRVKAIGRVPDPTSQEHVRVHSAQLHHGHPVQSPYDPAADDRIRQRLVHQTGASPIQFPFQSHHLIQQISL